MTLPAKVLYHAVESQAYAWCLMDFPLSLGAFELLSPRFRSFGGPCGASRMDHQPDPTGRLRDLDCDPQLQVLCALLLRPADARRAPALPCRPLELREPAAAGLSHAHRLWRRVPHRLPGRAGLLDHRRLSEPTGSGRGGHCAAH